MHILGVPGQDIASPFNNSDSPYPDAHVERGNSDGRYIITLNPGQNTGSAYNDIELDGSEDEGRDVIRVFEISNERPKSCNRPYTVYDVIVDDKITIKIGYDANNKTTVSIIADNKTTVHTMSRDVRRIQFSVDNHNRVRVIVDARVFPVLGRDGGDYFTITDYTDFRYGVVPYRDTNSCYGANEEPEIEINTNYPFDAQIPPIPGITEIEDFDGNGGSLQSYTACTASFNERVEGTSYQTVDYDINNVKTVTMPDDTIRASQMTPSDIEIDWPADELRIFEVSASYRYTDDIEIPYYDIFRAFFYDQEIVLKADAQSQRLNKKTIIQFNYGGETFEYEYIYDVRRIQIGITGSGHFYVFGDSNHVHDSHFIMRDQEQNPILLPTNEPGGYGVELHRPLLINGQPSNFTNNEDFETRLRTVASTFSNKYPDLDGIRTIADMCGTSITPSQYNPSMMPMTNNMKNIVVETSEELLPYTYKPRTEVRVFSISGSGQKKQVAYTPLGQNSFIVNWESSTLRMFEAKILNRYSGVDYKMLTLNLSINDVGSDTVYTVSQELWQFDNGTRVSLTVPGNNSQIFQIFPQQYDSMTLGITGDGRIAIIVGGQAYFQDNGDYRLPLQGYVTYGLELERDGRLDSNVPISAALYTTGPFFSTGYPSSISGITSMEDFNGDGYIGNPWNTPESGLLDEPYPNPLTHQISDLGVRIWTQRKLYDPYEIDTGSITHSVSGLSLRIREVQHREMFEDVEHDPVSHSVEVLNYDIRDVRVDRIYEDEPADPVSHSVEVLDYEVYIPDTVLAQLISYYNSLGLDGNQYVEQTWTDFQDQLSWQVDVLNDSEHTHADITEQYYDLIDAFNALTIDEFKYDGTFMYNGQITYSGDKSLGGGGNG